MKVWAYPLVILVFLKKNVFRRKKSQAFFLLNIIPSLGTYDVKILSLINFFLAFFHDLSNFMSNISNLKKKPDCL